MGFSRVNELDFTSGGYQDPATKTAVHATDRYNESQ